MKVKTTVIESRSPGQTRRQAAQMGKLLSVGDVLLFTAPLGAGKTTFIQGLVSALGVSGEAVSPTFVVAQTYSGRWPVHHLDFYRLKKNEVLGIGIGDYLGGSGAIEPGVLLIEWADRCPEIWPKERLEISIQLGRNPLQRRLLFLARGKRYEKILIALKKER